MLIILVDALKRGVRQRGSRQRNAEMGSMKTWADDNVGISLPPSDRYIVATEQKVNRNHASM